MLFRSQAGERGLIGDEVAGADLPLGDGVERLLHKPGRVVEAGLAGEFGVVQEVRVEVDAGLIGATAEEVDRAALAEQLHREVPDFGLSDGFDDDIGDFDIGVGLHTDVTVNIKVSVLGEQVA